MSRTAAVYLALFLVWEFLAFWLPLKRRLLNTRGIRQPGYSSYFRQSNKDYVAPHAAGVTFAMGIAAIWPTLYSYVCHRWECVYYFQLGMILIMADVAARLSVKVHTTKATLTATGTTVKGERTVVVQAKSPFPTGTAKGLLLPGRFFYLQVPDVSVCEWHPMSVTHADADGNLTFVIKVFGTLLLRITIA
eukprot:4682-Heterococcus_DN1.PRE.3